MAILLCAFVVLGVLSSPEAVRVAQRHAAYEAFRLELGVDRPNVDEASYFERVALFEQRREEVRQHNAKPGVLWAAVVNKFADYTEAEFHALFGHRSTRRPRGPTSVALLQVQPEMQLAQAVDWSQSLNSSTSPKDQGACGSCWAVAAAGALETHAEIAAKGPVPSVSYEQLVDCVENPDECGGTGGCKGATAELAFGFASKHALASKADYQGYQTGSGEGECRTPTSPVLSAQGFVRLPENEMQPLLEALATQGPVVVSADASGWGSYELGVFDSCEKNAVIGHAILAMGYGNDADRGVDYWLIRNSWGDDWGENGYIRLLRHSGDDFCGTDSKPLVGVGCKGGPETLPVCGMCGVLSDSAYPTGVKVLQKTLV